MDRYEVVRQIGQGAFGKAFLVRDKDGGGDRQSVVKQIDLRKFDGSSLRQLVSKICRGRYNPVPSRYSYELRLLLTQLFKVNPRDRPSVSSVLKRPLLEKHISKHLDPQGLRPCTAERSRKQEVRLPEHPHTPQDRKEEGQQEYLRQLEDIRQKYHQEMRQKRLRAEAEKGIMFEIRLDDEETAEDAEDEEADGRLKDEEVDPLNQTLSFQEGEELKLRDWSEERRGWSQRTPQTLLDALANMDVNSVYNTAVGAEQGEEAAGRRQWVDGPPNTLLNALAQAELTTSTVGAGLEPEDEEDEESDMEMDEERLEPRSDDDDTNFEESEDELRDAVADSMKNLFVPEDASSDDGTEENEDGDAASAADSQQNQAEVRGPPSDGVAGPPATVSSEGDGSNQNTTQTS
ncbi:Serine/threonine-protein kinase Nek5 [Larimichthys crocea]|nr:Serine/threonine-protein kinase Nek5 [Larimichthys crocea]